MDQSGANVTTTTEAVSTPANGVRIKVHADFTQAGVWTFLVQATATYTDSCNTTYTGTGTLSYLVTVVSVQMPPSPAYVGVGGEATLTPDVEPPEALTQVNFQVADSTVASLMGDAPELDVVGVAAGTTSLTATLVASSGQLLIGSANMGTSSVEVVGVLLSPSPLCVAAGKQASLTATVTPSDAASQVSFATDDGTIATVSGSAPNLTVTGVARGTTEVTASVAGQVLATATVNVGPLAVTLSPSPLSVAVNASANLAATVDPADESGDVTFDTADPSIATVPSSVTWDDDEALLPVSGVALGTTQVRAWAAGVLLATAVVNVTLPPSVTITTQTDRGLIQDPNKDLYSITLNAQITLTTDTIVWTLSGPGYDPNGTGYTWVTYTSGAQSNGIGSVAIALDKNSETWIDWDEDNSVTVTASSAANPNLQSQMTISLTKFRRKNTVAAGSLPVKVMVQNKRFNDPVVWWSLMNTDGTKDLLHSFGTPIAKASLNEEVVHRADQQFASGNYRIYYFCTNDKGDGSYSYRDTLNAQGRFDNSGFYNGWGHGATVTLAAARSASVDNTAIHITDSTVGDQFNGSPMTVQFGITADASTSGVGGSVGLSVSCQISTKDDIQDSQNTLDPYIFTFSGGSPVGQPVDVTKLLKSAAAADVNQINDDEWRLSVLSLQGVMVPWVTYLTFQPGF